MDVILTSTCRSTIVKTLESFKKNVHYSGDVHFILNIDVLSKNKKYFSTLMGFLKKLMITDININENPGGFHEGHTKAICYLYRRIESPIFFHLQDDWVFLKKINLDPLMEIMNKYVDIDHIRFSKEKIKEKTWLYHLSEEVSDEYLVPNTELNIDGLPFVHTLTWSFNPSLARTSVVKKFTNIPEGIRAETFICKNYPIIFNHQGTYIYGKIGSPPTVKDIGRNRFLNCLRKNKYILIGKKYADYYFGY